MWSCNKLLSAFTFIKFHSRSFPVITTWKKLFRKPVINVSPVLKVTKNDSDDDDDNDDDDDDDDGDDGNDDDGDDDNDDDDDDNDDDNKNNLILRRCQYNIFSCALPSLRKYYIQLQTPHIT